ncbi:hypothetical protein F383_33571 [Gossypium arboreum]|nr:hypothetical protein F383_33571 [Gossypium arboreum]
MFRLRTKEIRFGSGEN